MATVTQTQLMTFLEFEKVPDPKNGKSELRHGELFIVPPPNPLHYLIQCRLVELLLAPAKEFGLTGAEMGFRATPEHEYRIADVGVIAKARWSEALKASRLPGVPDLVIEVLSPSNTSSEILDKEALCLENGSKEFWVVDPERQQVKVSTPDGRTVSYKSGASIPLFFGGYIAVNEIFVQP